MVDWRRESRRFRRTAIQPLRIIQGYLNRNYHRKRVTLLYKMIRSLEHLIKSLRASQRRRRNRDVRALPVRSQSNEVKTLKVKTLAKTTLKGITTVRHWVRNLCQREALRKIIVKLNLTRDAVKLTTRYKRIIRACLRVSQINWCGMKDQKAKDQRDQVETVVIMM